MWTLIASSLIALCLYLVIKEKIGLPPILSSLAGLLILIPFLKNKDKKQSNAPKIKEREQDLKDKKSELQVIDKAIKKSTERIELKTEEIKEVEDKIKKQGGEDNEDISLEEANNIINSVINNSRDSNNSSSKE